MLDYVYGQNEIVAQFAASLIPSCRERGFARTATAIGVVEIEDGAANLIAGIIYHNWEPGAEIIEMSVAALPGKHWLTRDTINRMFQYPFLQLGCQMVVNRMSADDERLLRQCAVLGFSLIRVPRMLGRDRDGVLGFLTVEDWLANKFNQRLARVHAKAGTDELPTREAA